MKWRWTSQRGVDQLSNNDAIAIAKTNSLFFAVLTDAAAKTPNGAKLANHWSRELAAAIAASEQALAPSDAVQIMRRIHKELRNGFLHDIASYISVLVDISSGQAWCLSCGDCRMGIKTDQPNGIRWLSNVHTLANATGQSLSFTENSNPARHILTRSLNAKRFALPDAIALDTLLEGQSWILCSDGYWAEHLGSNIPLGEHRDDASCLEVSLSKPAGVQRTDCSNYRVYCPI